MRSPMAGALRHRASVLHSNPSPIDACNWEVLECDRVECRRHIALKNYPCNTNFLNACYSCCSGSPLSKGGWGGQCVALFYEIGINHLAIGDESGQHFPTSLFFYFTVIASEPKYIFRYSSMSLTRVLLSSAKAFI